MEAMSSESTWRIELAWYDCNIATARAVAGAVEDSRLGL